MSTQKSQALASSAVAGVATGSLVPVGLSALGLALMSPLLVMVFAALGGALGVGAAAAALRGDKD